MSLLIYIAGPMRGLPNFNFPAFFAAEKALLDESPYAFVFNPARRDEETYGRDISNSPTGSFADIPQFSLRDALQADTSWICRYAERVHMLQGWERSKGAIAERALAEALGLKITYEVQGDIPYTVAEQEAYFDGYDNGRMDG